jgi:uncharacterized delta-60 repeat protein
MRVRSEISAVGPGRGDERSGARIRGVWVANPKRLAIALAVGATLWLGADVASGAASSVAKAPSRVIFSVNAGAVSGDTDGGGAVAAVALPGGGAVLIGSTAQQRSGFYAAQLTPSGSLDASFGSGGIAQIAANIALSRVEQVVRQPDGKLVVVGEGDGSVVNKLRFPVVVLARLNADGSIDQSFGNGGFAQLPIQDSCGGCTGLALLPSGGFAVTGNTGQQAPAIAHDPHAVPNTQWVVALLTATGTLDPRFGQAGIATLPVPGGFGYDTAVMANGDIVALGHAGGSLYLTRLLPSGAQDPTFNAGTPAALPGGFGFGMVANPDGSVMVATRGGIVRYTTAGLPDPAFGPGGVAPVTSADLFQIQPAAGNGALVILQSGAHPGQIRVERLTANGTIDSTLGGPSGLQFEVPFGGGGSTFLVSKRLLPSPPLAQNTFRNGYFLPRPDGSYLLIGGVKVFQPTGEGQGKSIFDVAAAALTASFTPDASFGGPATPLHATLHIATQQNATTALKVHGIRVQVNLSAPGLCRVTIKANGRVIALSVLPVFAQGPTTLPVELTGYGNQWLRHRHHITLHATATARDLLTNTAVTATTGVLH